MRWTPTLLALLALSLTPPAAAGPGRVLGVEAEAPVKRWLKALAPALDHRGARIAQDAVEVQLSGCVLTLHHPDAPRCRQPDTHGDLLACWVGDTCPDAASRTRALATAGPLTLRWRQVASDAGADLARSQALAARQLAALEPDAARATLLQAVGTARGSAALHGLAMLPVAGGGPTAIAASRRPDIAGLGPEAVTAVVLNALVGPRLTAEALAPLLPPDRACPLVDLGRGWLAAERYTAATTWLAAVRRADPTCADAYRDEAEARTHRNDWDGVRAVLAAARQHHPDAPWLVAIDNAVLAHDGDVATVITRLEARVGAGDRTPGLFKRLLGFYLQKDLVAQHMARYVALADNDPADEVAAFFAGILLHYDRKWDRSNQLLEGVRQPFAHEPRLYIYLAMNHFNLGHQQKAEGLIDEAAELDLTDPDVYYCRGEIYRDRDRPRARRALEVYWHQTRNTSDPTSSKQQRVKAMIDALDACIARSEPGPCPGMWEHFPNGVVPAGSTRYGAEP